MKSGVKSAVKSSNDALKVVASKKAEFALEIDGNIDVEVPEDVQQKRDEYERDLIHAERVLRVNINTKAYLRRGPFELFDDSLARHSIGLMDEECNYCHAMRFSSESPSFCCENGKINLPLRRDPPPILKSLMEDTTAKG